MIIADMQVTPIHPERWGTDLDVVNAARVSFGKESDAITAKDVKLIRYLAEHKHFSPFNHSFLSFRIKAPIFVARQLQKHRFMPWNETSRRYVDDEPEFYMPDMWRKKAENVKQGSSHEDFGLPKRTGKCLHCAGELPQGRFKFCCDAHQVYHSNQRLPFNTKFRRWKATAKQHNIPWDLEMDDLDWPKVCVYLDCELNYQSDNLADNVASLDKIIPELGYVKGNVQIISNLANRMKSSATVEQMLLFSKNTALMHGGIFTEQAPSYEKFLEQCSKTYTSMIKDGMSPEQARMFLPQSAMTEWIWSGTLGAFLDMLVLRLDPHTQKESRDVAEMIAMHVQRQFPVSFKARIISE